MGTKSQSIQSPLQILHLLFSTVSSERAMAASYAGQESSGDGLDNGRAEGMGDRLVMKFAMDKCKRKRY